MRPLFFFLFFSCLAPLYAQQCPLAHPLLQQAQARWGQDKFNYNYNCRSDSADILRYSIELDMLHWHKKTLRGNCMIDWKPLVAGLDALTLDMLLRVDSVVWQGQRLRYETLAEQVRIRFPQALPIGEPQSLRIYYQGVPPTGDWNGFYFSNDFAYNMGSSFDANPLNYGRAWYPCFDNFKERAEYQFNIKTKAPKIAQCNGTLLRREQRRDTIWSHWSLTDPIPSYLACIAVADFIVQRDTFQGIERRIPIELAAVADDTAALARGFRRLPQAIATMEKWFGPYSWNKVGYSVVPDLSGAMEHATNTTFSSDLLRDASVAEEFMIHELAHSWFGNQMTCETGEDMWINEGLATYSEALFYEYAYGRPAFLNKLNDCLYEVMPYNARDTFFPPLAGATHAYTYDGKLIYNRGALIGHALRAYLGDARFAQGMQSVLRDFRHRSINSVQLRDALGAATGVDLRDFFNEWVFQGGYLDIALDSCHTQGNTARVWLRQRLLGRETHYNKIPLELTLIGKQQERQTVSVVLDSAQQSFSFKNLPFEPALVLTDADYRLFLAQARRLIRLDSSKARGYYPVLDMTEYQVATKAAITAYWQLHYTQPEGTLPAGYRLSRYGYWEYGEQASAKAEASARFAFSSAHSDVLSAQNDYRIVLMYRPHGQAQWTEWTGAILTYTNREKRIGKLEARGLRSGYYAIGVKTK